ncbi:MAG: HAD family hydrolase [Candidatus Woesearchaeota archaeon]
MTRLQNFDLDGTIIDSANAVKDCQISGLVKATSKDYGTINKELSKSNLNSMLKKYNIDKNIFFSEYYKTFNPFEAKEKGYVKLFDDANIVRLHNLNSGMINSLVSNSSLNATNQKLEAFDIGRFFNYVFAEFESSKAKPNSYMAKQLVEKLKDDGLLDDIVVVNNFGDQLVDMEFGEVLNEEISSSLAKKPQFNNYLLNRDGLYVPKDNIILINSINEVYNLR